MAESGGSGGQSLQWASFLWGVATDIVGWVQYTQQRNAAMHLRAVTTYLDQNLYRDKAAALIWRLDVTRNLRLVAGPLAATIDTTMRDQAKGGTDAQRRLAGKALVGRTLVWLRSMGPLTLDDPMPSYRTLTDPIQEVGAIIVDDSGYYPPQQRIVLPPLVDIGGSPLVPTWAAGAGMVGAGMAFGPAGWMGGGLAAAASQVVRTPSKSKVSVRQFLEMTRDGRVMLDAHNRLWAKPPTTKALAFASLQTMDMGILQCPWTLAGNAYYLNWEAANRLARVSARTIRTGRPDEAFADTPMGRATTATYRGVVLDLAKSVSL